MPKLSPKLVFTAEQRETLKALREQVERDRPEIVAEGQRVAKATELVNVQLQGVFTLLKTLRKSQNVSLTTLAEKTGISKGALSRLENDPSPNVTLTTLQRVADALGHSFIIALAPKGSMPTPESSKGKKETRPQPGRQLAKLVGKVKVQ